MPGRTAIRLAPNELRVGLRIAVLDLGRRAGLGELAVHFGGDLVRRDLRHGRLDLVLERAGDDVVLASHERLEAVARDIGGIVLLVGTNLVSSMLARLKKLVSVGPGCRAVTVIFVSFNSFRSASAKERRNAFDAP